MRRFPWFAVALMCAGAAVSPPARAQAKSQPKQTRDWPVYDGQTAGDHYSPLTQINRANVAKLRVAWKFDTGEQGGLETNPIIVGHVLYAYTPTQKVIALDAATGRLIWKFDSGIAGTAPARGVAYWSDGKDTRILAGVMNYLYALDAATGKPIPTFGENGRVDLRKGLDRDYHTQSVALTTPGLIYKDLIILSGRDPETHPAPPGTVRAFDVRSGALRWQFHTIPHPGEPGYDTWPKDAWKTAGAANNWAGMALDTRRGIVYVPTGSAVFDFYGGDRIGNDLYADTLLALDANTGRLIWHFQGVHHDIWDRDFPSPPALVTLIHKGRQTDAIAQTTKLGYLYAFDRVTGRSLFPIEEEPYPTSDVPGEATSPTQPRPLLPKPFARQILTAEMLTNRTPQAHMDALQRFLSFRSAGQFVPFALDRQTVIFPGFDGGAEWGGPAIDPERGIIYVNANEMAWTGGLTTDAASASLGENVYQHQCSLCHGDDRAGSPPTYPSLLGIETRLTPEQIRSVIHKGRGRMPAFDAMSDSQVDAVLDYLKQGSQRQTHATPNRDAQYQFTGYRKFLDIDGYPAIAPPWGTLNAIDLNTGKYLWKIPFGEYPALARKGIANTGSENYGGPVLTASGLLFIGATVFDRQMHAFDSSTGKLLWHATLPFSGVATPATYMVDGKQFVVIGAGGGRDGKQSGGVYVAFALP
ncbi:MAG TPA: PQQ-binding-like beta-propeller repeat protein [Silvibacterium sp.]|nr:PQQ-binding-like beta-propeller repeat protein [Silvibacterium sp.]